jgi:hypothetical protein
MIIGLLLSVGERAILHGTLKHICS